MAIITLTTDFGESDHYVGLMKGVMLGIAPDATLVDISHALPPQDLRAGSYVLDAVVDCFPDGTIHCAVVDPGVGSARRAVCIQTGRAYLVGPDNGLFSAYLQREPMRRAVRLTNATYHRQPVSDTFHGRDIFAPVAAHLAAGVAMDELGEPIDGVLHLPLSEPNEADDGTLQLTVLHIDHFGNLITDLPRDAFERWLDDRNPDDVELRLPATHINGIHRTFADVSDGELVAYFGSTGRLEIAIRNGNAAESLDVGRGRSLTLTARDDNASP